MKRNIEFIVVHVGQPGTTANQTSEAKTDEPAFHYHITHGGTAIKQKNKSRNSALGIRSGNECICIGVESKSGRTAPNRSQEHTLFDTIVELTERYPSAKVVAKEYFDAKESRSQQFDVHSWLASYVPDLAQAA